ncbi:MAG: phosphoribosylanthranilate isomerase [Caldilineaceae bacterium]|nr:phosphoribosylanthranilate isomerase [Caldilineaceae bacterium]
MTHVKICGITSFEDGLCAASAGADYLGFIFFEKSPRYIAPEAAGEITSRLAEHLSDSSRRMASGAEAGQTPHFIGVFVNESLEAVEKTICHANLDFAQLHGEETPAMLEALRGRGFKALRPTSAAEAEIEAEWYAGLGPSSGPQLLVDAYDPNEYGGTGKRADWKAAAGLGRIYPRLVLAGGLTPKNVVAAVEVVRPWAVDVCSGVEFEPGRKDPDKVREFIFSAKGRGQQARDLNAG